MSRRLPVEPLDGLGGQAELVGLSSGTDFLVSAGTDIGIEPEGDWCFPFQSVADLADALELVLALDIDLLNMAGKSEADLVEGLADAGKDNAIGIDTRGKAPVYLSFGDHIGTCPELAEQIDDGKVAVRLDRIEDPGMAGGHGLREGPVAPAQRCRAVAIEGSTDRVGKNGQIHILGMELALAVGKSVQLSPGSSSAPGGVNSPLRPHPTSKAARASIRATRLVISDTSCVLRSRLRPPFPAQCHHSSNGWQPKPPR